MSEAGVPPRRSIVIDSLFTKNMHNEFIMARRERLVASSYQIQLRLHTASAYQNYIIITLDAILLITDIYFHY